MAKVNKVKKCGEDFLSPPHDTRCVDYAYLLASI